MKEVGDCTRRKCFNLRKISETIKQYGKDSEVVKGKYCSSSCLYIDQSNKNRKK